jgi:hypothetical protein
MNEADSDIYAVCLAFSPFTCYQCLDFKQELAIYTTSKIFFVKVDVSRLSFVNFVFVQWSLNFLVGEMFKIFCSPLHALPLPMHIHRVDADAISACPSPEKKLLRQL